MRQGLGIVEQYLVGLVNQDEAVSSELACQNSPLVEHHLINIDVQKATDVFVYLLVRALQQLGCEKDSEVLSATVFILKYNHSGNDARLALARRDAEEVALMPAVTQGRDGASELIVVDTEVVLSEDVSDALLLLHIILNLALRQVHAHLFQS